MKPDKHDITKIFEWKMKSAHLDKVAIIIARGGSRRLPRKNVLNFCGKPLVAWSIIQAVNSHLIDGVYLSTDDDEIADIGQEYGAEIIRRPDWPDADRRSANPVYLHAIEEIRKVRPLDVVSTILPTGPIRNPYDFDETMKMYLVLNEAIQNRRVAVATPQLEMIIYKNIMPNVGEAIIFDKNYGYSDAGSGTWSACDTDDYIKWASLSTAMYDDVNDKMMPYQMENLELERKYFWYYPMEIWQSFDIDLKEHFDLDQIIFAQYLLLPYGPNLYEDYYNGKLELKRKDIEYARD